MPWGLERCLGRGSKSLWALSGSRVVALVDQWVKLPLGLERILGRRPC